MTLRHAQTGDRARVHEVIDDLINREDSLILAIDGTRVISYGGGFGVSPCQLELLILEIERAVRGVVGDQSSTGRRRRKNRETSNDDSNSGSRSGASESLLRPGSAAGSRGGRPAGRLLRVAGESPPADRDRAMTTGESAGACQMSAQLDPPDFDA